MRFQLESHRRDTNEGPFKFDTSMCDYSQEESPYLVWKATRCYPMSVFGEYNVELVIAFQAICDADLFLQ